MSLSVKVLRSGLALVWAAGLLVRSPYPGLAAQAEPLLPAPGQVLGRSTAFRPAGLRGLRVYPQNPFELDFIIQPGQDEPQGIPLDQAQTLIQYFLATLTTPADDIWVNLSPVEPDKIIPEGFAQTRMGRDLLAQDYVLKQLTASLLHPDGAEGQAFWARVQDQVAQRTGVTDMPVDTFNRVWIVPDQAEVYENAGAVYIVQSRLRVMLERDFLSEEGRAQGGPGGDAAADQAMREIVLPALEEEVNGGAHFAPLRQVYQAMILATWYKTRLRDSLLNQVYADQGKTAGIAVVDPAAAREEIYARYLAAVEDGAFALIKEDADPVTRQPLPRKYFSGGFDGLGPRMSAVIRSSPLSPEAVELPGQQLFYVELQAAPRAGSSPVSRARLDNQGPEASFYMLQVGDSQDPQVLSQALTQLFDLMDQGRRGLRDVLQEVVVQRRTQTVIGDGRILVALDQALDRLGVDRDQALAQGYVQALDSPDLPVRQQAVAALSRPRYRTATAYPALLERFKDQEESLFVKRLSVRALLNQLDPSDGQVPRLTALMDQKTRPADPDFASAGLRAEIVRALIEMGQAPLAAAKDADLAQWREKYGPGLIRRLPFLKEGQITDARILAAVQQETLNSSPVLSGNDSSVGTMTFEEAEAYKKLVIKLREVAESNLEDIYEADLIGVLEEELARWRQSIPEEAMTATVDQSYTKDWNRPEVNQRLRALRDIFDKEGRQGRFDALADRFQGRYRTLHDYLKEKKLDKYKLVIDDLFGVVLDFSTVAKLSSFSFQKYLESTIPIAEARAEVASWARWVDDLSRRFTQYQWLLSDHLYRPELIDEEQPLLSATSESDQAAPIYRDLLVPYREAVSRAKEIVPSSPIADEDWPRAEHTLTVLQKYAGEIREQLSADGFLDSMDQLRAWVAGNDPQIIAAIAEEKRSGELFARVQALAVIVTRIKSQSGAVVRYFQEDYFEKIEDEQGTLFFPVEGLPASNPIFYDLRHCPLNTLQIFYSEAAIMADWVSDMKAEAKGDEGARVDLAVLQDMLSAHYKDMAQTLKIFDQYLLLINEHILAPEYIDRSVIAEYREPDGSPVHIYPAFLLPYRESLLARQADVEAPFSSVTATQDTVGGIALNPDRLNLLIRRGPDGMPLPMTDQPVGDLQVDGLIPVIINVTPVTNLPLLLGAQDAPSAPAAADRLSRRLP